VEKTWSHCGRCRTQIENEEETSATQLESTEAEKNPNEVLRGLLNDEKGLEELMSYTPQGYSETMLEYFRFGNTSHFKQKVALLCAQLLLCFDVRKIHLLRFDNPRRLRLYFDHLKLLLLPFVENLEPCYLWLTAEPLMGKLYLHKATVDPSVLALN